MIPFPRRSVIHFLRVALDTVEPKERTLISGGYFWNLHLVAQIEIASPRSVYVVEIKRKARIGDSVVEEVRQKVERLALPKSKSVKTVLVYDGELDPSVEENDFFDYLIPAEKLLVRSDGFIYRR